MSAKSLQHRWKHEIQINLVKSSHETSSSADPFSTLHHWGHVPPLDGGIGDHDHVDSEADTAIPDDDDDIAHHASQPSASLQPSSFQLCPPAPVVQFASFFSVFPGDLQLDACSLRRPRGCLGCLGWSLNTLALDRAVHQRCFPAQLSLSDRETDRGSTGESALTPCKTSEPPPHSPLHSAHFPFQLLDLAHVWSERQDNDIHISDVFTLAAAVYIFRK